VPLVESRLPRGAASLYPNAMEGPNETQRLDTIQIGALLAQTLPSAALQVRIVAPKQVITPNRKVPATRPVLDAGSVPARAKKECEEEEELLLDLTGL
jgi:hypothetical protein